MDLKPVFGPDSLLTAILGSLSILNLVSRPIPSIREWLRMEGQTGRYFQHNLLSVAWAELALQYFQDTEFDLFHYIISDLLKSDPFVTSC